MKLVNGPFWIRGKLTNIPDDASIKSVGLSLNQAFTLIFENQELYYL